jgi:hypothetical protein
MVIDSVFLGRDSLSKVDIEKVRSFLLRLKVAKDSLRDVAIYYRDRYETAQGNLVAETKKPKYDPTKQKVVDKNLGTYNPETEAVIDKKTKVVRQGEKTVDANASVYDPKKDTAISRNTSTSTGTANAEEPDPVPSFKAPFMLEANWRGKADLDLLLTDESGATILCKQLACKSKFAELKSSGKKDTIQFEQLTVTTRIPKKYELRGAIYTRPGAKKVESVVFNGYYIVKPLGKRGEKKSISKLIKAGSVGKVGTLLGTLEVFPDNNVIFTPTKD